MQLQLTVVYSPHIETDIGAHTLLVTKLTIFSLLLFKQWLLKFLEIYNASFGS